MVALATVVAASALAIVLIRSDGTEKPANAAAVQQVIVPPPDTTPPPTEATAPPTTAPASTTTAPPTTATTVAPPPEPKLEVAAVAPPVAPALPLTLGLALQQAMSGVNGCLLVQDDDGTLKTVFDYNSGGSFVPASSQKVLVAAALLARLGPNYRYETKVVASRPVENSELHDAWLVGGGDPYLVTPEYAHYLSTKPRTAGAPITPLALLADELVNAGVRSIPGGLQTDESRYPPQRFVPTWKPSYVTEAEAGSLGALTVNQGLSGWGPNQKVSADPPIDAANALGRLLTDRGVTVPAPTAGSKAPGDGVVIATIRSAPLGELVAAMLRASDNFVAEMLVKELDHNFGGPGLTAGGTARVVEELARLGVPVEGTRLADGSGLDRGNLATCRTLLGALSLSRQPQFSILDSGLAIAGGTGTLSKRYKGTPAESRLAAKTGWINGCAAMVGRFVDTPLRRFALVFNGEFGWPHAQAVQDRVVAAITSGLPL